VVEGVENVENVENVEGVEGVENIENVVIVERTSILIMKLVEFVKPVIVAS